MSRYRIFEPLNMYEDDIFKTTISLFTYAHNHNDNAYYIQTGTGRHYLIVDGPIGNISLNRMFVHELTPKQLFDLTGLNLIEIKYSNKGNDLVITSMKISEYLDGFCCNQQELPMILTSNKQEQKIDFYSILDMVKPTKITETYAVGDIISKYRASRIKQILNDNEDNMYNYFISYLIDKQCPSKRYEVKI